MEKTKDYRATLLNTSKFWGSLFWKLALLEPSRFSKDRVFISGSFKENKKEFDEVEKFIKWINSDIEIVRMDKFWETQTYFDTTNWEKIDYWLRDLEFLHKCKYAIFLPGWRKHDGCRLERKFAELNGIEIFIYEEV